MAVHVRLSESEAVKLLEAQRLALSRVGISKEHWELVRIVESSQGHNKESYEHAFHLQATKTPATHSSSGSTERMTTYVPYQG